MLTDLRGPWTVGHEATLELQPRDKYGNNRAHYSVEDGSNRVFGGSNDTLTLGEPTRSAGV